MNVNEARWALRKIRAYCPAQHFDEDSPAAWAENLADLRLVDVLEAIADLGGEQAFIGVEDVRRRVMKIRNRRIDDHGPVEPPVEVAENVEAYQAWWRDTLR